MSRWVVAPVFGMASVQKTGANALRLNRLELKPHEINKPLVEPAFRSLTAAFAATSQRSDCLWRTEEDLDHSAIGKHQDAYFRWEIQSIGGDPQDAVTIHSGRTAQ